jgi:hypothetical protein
MLAREDARAVWIAPWIGWPGAGSAAVGAQPREQPGSDLAAGIIASVAFIPVLRTFLAGVSPFDPLSFGSAALLLGVVGLGAGYLPARGSARLDPMAALRRG